MFRHTWSDQYLMYFNDFFHKERNSNTVNMVCSSCRSVYYNINNIPSSRTNPTPGPCPEIVERGGGSNFEFMGYFRKKLIRPPVKYCLN